MKNEKEFKMDLQLFTEGDDEGGGKVVGVKDEFEEEVERILKAPDIEADVLKGTFEKVVKKYKDAKNKARDLLHEVMAKKELLKKSEDEKEAERLKKLKDNEDYKKIIDELEPKVKTLAADTAKTQLYFEKQLSKKIEQVPEEYKDLVPKGIDIRDQIEWLDTFLGKIKKEGGKEETKPASVNAGGTGPKGETGPEATTITKIADGLIATKNVKELEELLRKHGRRG